MKLILFFYNLIQYIQWIIIIATYSQYLNVTNEKFYIVCTKSLKSGEHFTTREYHQSD